MRYIVIILMLLTLNACKTNDDESHMKLKQISKPAKVVSYFKDEYSCTINVKDANGEYVGLVGKEFCFEIGYVFDK